ncbi:MAG: hypothetical protein RLZZ227_1057 [Pseudomonadota bacterium]|jgi:hypothetical protein
MLSIEVWKAPVQHGVLVQEGLPGVAAKDYLYYVFVDHCVQFSQLFQLCFSSCCCSSAKGLHEMQGCLARTSKPALSFIGGSRKRLNAEGTRDGRAAGAAIYQ